MISLEPAAPVERSLNCQCRNSNGRRCGKPVATRIRDISICARHHQRLRITQRVEIAGESAALQFLEWNDSARAYQLVIQIESPTKRSAS